jgi:type IV pilus assembly protein PilX
MSRKTLPRRQRGMTMLMVLVLMTVMLLGGMALARITEIGTLAAGNSAFREASLQASEVGLNNAFAAVRGLVDEEVATGSWYWPTIQAADTKGIPTVVNWTNTPQITVGSYTVTYAVERLCSVTPVSNSLVQCLVKEQPSKIESARPNDDPLESPNSHQFRITVRVVGPKDTETWIQSLMTKGTT